MKLSKKCNIDAVLITFLMGQPPASFCLFSFVSKHKFNSKIRTRVVRVDGDHDDHLTTTTSPGCLKLCNLYPLLATLFLHRLLSVFKFRPFRQLPFRLKSFGLLHFDLGPFGVMSFGLVIQSSVIWAFVIWCCAIWDFVVQSSVICTFKVWT